MRKEREREEEREEEGEGERRGIIAKREYMQCIDVATCFILTGQPKNMALSYNYIK